MRYTSYIPEAVTILLRENGYMTKAELVEATGLPRDAVSRALSRMMKASAEMPKRVHIQSYVIEMDGQRDYPRPVYALGDKPDVKKPKPKKASENTKKWRARQKARYALNSVFNMGVSLKSIKRTKHDPTSDHTSAEHSSVPACTS